MFWMWTSTKAFWAVFIFRCLDMTPAWRLFLSCDAQQQLPSKTAEQQSSVLNWESPSMWTGGLLWLASGDVSFYVLTIARPEQFKTVDQAASVDDISPAHRVQQIVRHRLCVDMLLRVCTRTVMMDELVFDGWALLSWCCGRDSVIKGWNVLLSR